MPVSEILERQSPLVNSPDKSTSTNNSSKSQSSNSLSITDVDETNSVRDTLLQNLQRLEINRAIDTTNVASQAVEDIPRLFEGIQGIVEQAQDPALSQDKVLILEREAEELRQQIRKSSQVTTQNGTKPLSGDPIRVEIEATIGKTLEVILPDDAAKAFGLPQIRLSPREVIINTIASVERAKQGILKLRAGVHEGTSQLKDAVTSLEIAQQNREASKTSLRDVEDALKVAHNTRQGIKEDPKEALGSLGEISDAAKLL